MYLTHHEAPKEPCWALDGHCLPPGLGLGALLALPRPAMIETLRHAGGGSEAVGALLAPLAESHEVWAAGVTYMRSREAREAESSVSDVYARVYDAQRPELFFKAIGRRVAGHGHTIRVRRDSRWNVPEPELTLVVNAHSEVVGFCAGNDVSSRDIEGENPLYLPQAKVYDGSCALGPGIVLSDADALTNLSVRCDVWRSGALLFRGETTTAQMKRRLDDLVQHLTRELAFPSGVFLMTGTGIVPPPEFSLSSGDHVRVTVGPLTLANDVA